MSLLFFPFFSPARNYQSSSLPLPRTTNCLPAGNPPFFLPLRFDDGLTVCPLLFCCFFSLMKEAKTTAPCLLFFSPLFPPSSGSQKKGPSFLPLPPFFSPLRPSFPLSSTRRGSHTISPLFSLCLSSGDTASVVRHFLFLSSFFLFSEGSFSFP